MVISYEDIYESIDENLPVQDWYTPEWNSSYEGDSLTVYRDDWREDDELEACFYSYGQGEDPERNPIVLEIRLGGILDEQNEKMDALEDKIQQDLKPLIGWEIVQEDDLFARKELPSDPLTLKPRLLEEFKKLEPIAYRIDELLGYAERNRAVETAATGGATDEGSE